MAQATTDTNKRAKREPVPMNGVDTPALFATIESPPDITKECERTDSSPVGEPDQHHTQRQQGEQHGPEDPRLHVGEQSEANQRQVAQNQYTLHPGLGSRWRDDGGAQDA